MDIEKLLNEYEEDLSTFLAKHDSEELELEVQNLETELDQLAEELHEIETTLQDIAEEYVEHDEDDSRQKLALEWSHTKRKYELKLNEYNSHLHEFALVTCIRRINSDGINIDGTSVSEWVLQGENPAPNIDELPDDLQAITEDAPGIDIDDDILYDI